MGLGRAVLRAVCRVGGPPSTTIATTLSGDGSGGEGGRVPYATRREAAFPSEIRRNHSAACASSSPVFQSSMFASSISPLPVAHPRQHRRHHRHHRHHHRQRAEPPPWTRRWSFRSLASSAAASSSSEWNSRYHADPNVQLPQRPDEPVCTYYVERGRCKFGDACKYHHPLDGDANRPSRISFVNRMGVAKDAGDYDAVASIFEELCDHYPEDHGQAAYEILIRCAAMEGDPRGARDALEAMMALGYGPKVHTHGKIVLAYNNANKPRKSLQWVNKLAESEGAEYMLNEHTMAGVRLFNKVLEAGAREESFFPSSFTSPSPSPSAPSSITSSPPTAFCAVARRCI